MATKKIQARIYLDTVNGPFLFLVDQVIFYKEDIMLSRLSAVVSPECFHLQDCTLYINRDLALAVEVKPFEKKED